MKDLADLAGVAKITVSRALRDSPLVRPELAKQIRQLASDHGYRLNTAARNLRLRRTQSVLVVMEMDPTVERPMSEPPMLTLVGGLLHELTSARYRMILTTHSQLDDSSTLDADGIVLVGQGVHDEATRALRRYRAPLVVWGAPTEGDDGIVFVGSDNRDGGRLIGDHLRGAGRRALLFLGDDAYPEVAERLAGVRESFSKRGNAISAAPCPFSRIAARQVVAGLLAAGRAFDAIAAASDSIALGAIDAVEASARRTPEDIAVTGFDDTATERPLTSVRQEWDLGGRLLARKVMDLISGEPAVSEFLPVRMIARHSSA